MNRIQDIHERVERLENKLDKIIHILESNQKSCDKMSKHIDFVDGVYDVIKSPLNIICSAVSSFSLNYNSKSKILELPAKKTIKD